MNSIIERNTAELIQHFQQEDPKGLHALLVKFKMQADMQTETVSTGCTGKWHGITADQFE